MADKYIPQVGDRVRFNNLARRSNFGDEGKPDARKRMTVVTIYPTHGFATPDVRLDDGAVWNACWLEPVGSAEVIPVVSDDATAEDEKWESAWIPATLIPPADFDEDEDRGDNPFWKVSYVNG